MSGEFCGEQEEQTQGRWLGICVLFESVQTQAHLLSICGFVWASLFCVDKIEGVNPAYKGTLPSSIQRNKNTMDCAICMEPITKATGSTVLSCEHAFHFRCIDSWFTKQVYDDLAQTCPCCRSGGCEMDRCSVMEMEDGDEEEEDDETYADAESETATDMPDEEELEDIRWERLGPGRWMIVNSQELALEGVRGLFGPLNELDAVEEDNRDIAARKIQAIFRGTQVRNHHKAAMGLLRLLTYAYTI